MKSKKIIASVLFATLALSATACGKEPIATAPEESIVTETSATESLDPVTDPSDLDADAVDDAQESDTFPYTLGDFGDASVSVDAKGAEVLVANVDSDFGTYSCAFANYAQGSTIRVEVTADESITSLTYSAVFSENYTAPSSGTIANGAVERNEDGVFVIEFTDEQSVPGVYYLNIQNGDEGQAFVNISVGYTADTIVDYFSVENNETEGDTPVVESGASASETTT